MRDSGGPGPFPVLRQMLSCKRLHVPIDFFYKSRSCPFCSLAACRQGFVLVQATWVSGLTNCRGEGLAFADFEEGCRYVVWPVTSLQVSLLTHFVCVCRFG